MKQHGVACSVALVITLCLAGCGPSEPSLTGAQLAQNYPEKKYVQIDGVSLHYEQEGLGRPLVFLHGYPTYSYLWRDITPGLTFGNTIYNLDLMGFGFSEKPQDKTYSLEFYVDQLGKFLDTLHLENPILVGHHAGGVIVTLYTVRHPDSVRKLIVLDAPLYQNSTPLSLRLLRTRVVGELLMGDWFLKRFLRGGVEKPEVMTDTLLDAYLKPYQDDPGGRAALLKFIREFTPQPLLENEIQPNLTKLQLPTLMVWGAHDPYVPLEFGRRLDEVIPNSTLGVILRSGHYVQEERPEDVRAVLKEFIEQ